MPTGYNPGGGATIPSTTNLIAGDGAGNGADSGIDPATVITNAGAGSVYTFISPSNAAIGTILMANGTGVCVPAVPGTDYLAPGPLPDGTTATTQALGDNSTKVATTAHVTLEVANAISTAINQLLANPDALGQLISAAGITPATDGTSTPVTSVSTVGGIVTDRQP